MFGLLRSVEPGPLGLPPGEATALFAAAAIIQGLAIACFLGGRGPCTGVARAT